ncbi:energy transducer TonB [Chryseobacterium sp.]|uniref:energy transducer TonB n=1 Tax=Chryseobacterium sp. TaxID=1871047 RepID=UPI00388F90E5
MINKIRFISVLFVSALFSNFNAQILDEYPTDQYFYEGGEVSLYKEIHQILVDEKVSNCDAKEIYQPRIIVTKEGSVKIVKDTDVDQIAKNKCAYDVSMLVLKNLNNWKPAEVYNNKYSAITEFIVYPKHLMNEYKEGYVASRYLIPAQYPKGFKAFDKDLHDNFMALFSDYHINGKFNLEFYISEEGKIINPRIFPSIFDPVFNNEFLRTLSRLKKVWKPAFYNDIPIKYRISNPMSFSITFEER